MKKNILLRKEQTQADLDAGFGNLSSCLHPNDTSFNEAHVASWARVGVAGCGKSVLSSKPHMGMGQKLSHQGTAGFSPCFHLPWFLCGYLFLAQPHVAH